jgi:ParB-like chromosome segregation protein Spo0J
VILQAGAKHIELWPIDKLIPYGRNPRTHSDAQVAQIADSIRAFGFNNPILVDTQGRHHRRPRAPSGRTQAAAL